MESLQILITITQKHIQNTEIILNHHTGGQILSLYSSSVIEHDSISHIKIHIQVALLHSVCSLLYMPCSPVGKRLAITVTCHVTHDIRQNGGELSLKISN